MSKPKEPTTGPETVKVYTKFLYMSLTYYVYDDIGHFGKPDVRRYGIFNDGTVRIQQFSKDTEKAELDDTYHTDVYDVAELFIKIKAILDSDCYDKDTVELKSSTTDIQFEIVYSPAGHKEICSPFLVDENGTTVMSVIDAFLEFVRNTHTYYDVYEVAFSEFSSHGYSYFYDDDSLQIGDKVIVPIGEEEKTSVATVIGYWRYAKEHLPYPAEKIKKIIKKVEESSGSD